MASHADGSSYDIRSNEEATVLVTTMAVTQQTHNPDAAAYAADATAKAVSSPSATAAAAGYKKQLAAYSIPASVAAAATSVGCNISPQAVAKLSLKGLQPSLTAALTAAKQLSSEADMDQIADAAVARLVASKLLSAHKIADTGGARSVLPPADTLRIPGPTTTTTKSTPALSTKATAQSAAESDVCAETEKRSVATETEKRSVATETEKRSGAAETCESLPMRQIISETRDSRVNDQEYLKGNVSEGGAEEISKNKLVNAEKDKDQKLDQTNVSTGVTGTLEEDDDIGSRSDYKEGVSTLEDVEKSNSNYSDGASGDDDNDYDDEDDDDVTTSNHDDDHKDSDETAQARGHAEAKTTYDEQNIDDNQVIDDNKYDDDDHYLHDQKKKVRYGTSSTRSEEAEHQVKKIADKTSQRSSTSLGSDDQVVESLRSGDQVVESLRSGDQEVESLRYGDQEVESLRSGDQEVESLRSVDQELDSFPHEESRSNVHQSHQLERPALPQEMVDLLEEYDDLTLDLDISLEYHVTPTVGMINGLVELSGEIINRLLSEYESLSNEVKHLKAKLAEIGEGGRQFKKPQAYLPMTSHLLSFVSAAAPDSNQPALSKSKSGNKDTNQRASIPAANVSLPTEPRDANRRDLLPSHLSESDKSNVPSKFSSSSPLSDRDNTSQRHSPASTDLVGRSRLEREYSLRATGTGSGSGGTQAEQYQSNRGTIDFEANPSTNYKKSDIISNIKTTISKRSERRHQASQREGKSEVKPKDEIMSKIGPRIKYRGDIMTLSVIGQSSLYTEQPAAEEIEPKPKNKKQKKEKQREAKIIIGNKSQSNNCRCEQKFCRGCHCCGRLHKQLKAKKYCDRKCKHGNGGSDNCSDSCSDKLEENGDEDQRKVRRGECSGGDERIDGATFFDIASDDSAANDGKNRASETGKKNSRTSKPTFGPKGRNKFLMSILDFFRGRR